MVNDNGCELYPDCFTCPFTDCLIGKKGISKSQLRREHARLLMQKGKPVNDIAEQLGVTPRQVLRYKQTYLVDKPLGLVL
uniref:Putative DNA binding, helix-turn-helix domain containing protein n=1 Tax=viral metagenome TaxID=1070528 RepID=A0A6M3KGZ8_9ZZZZ